MIINTKAHNSTKYTNIFVLNMLMFPFIHRPVDRFGGNNSMLYLKCTNSVEALLHLGVVCCVNLIYYFISDVIDM